MTQAARIQATALRALTKNGQAATYRRTTRSGGDNAWTPNASTSDTAVIVFPWGLHRQTQEGSRTAAMASRFLLSAAGLAFVPVADDMLIVGATDTWRITGIERYPVNGVETFFVLHGEWHG